MKYLVFLAAILITACTDDAGSYRALSSQGFTDIKLTGYELFGCGDDSFSTGFEATNAQGRRVSGVVCCGMMKACTVRF